MDVSVVQPTVTKAPVPAGLSSAEASRRLLEYGPNAVVEERVHPVAQIVRHFWAPVPWMLEATIALQIAIGERLEALMIATLLILNVALLGSAHWWRRDLAVECRGSDAAMRATRTLAEQAFHPAKFQDRRRILRSSRPDLVSAPG